MTRSVGMPGPAETRLEKVNGAQWPQTCLCGTNSETVKIRLVETGISVDKLVPASGKEPISCAMKSCCMCSWSTAATHRLRAALSRDMYFRPRGPCPDLSACMQVIQSCQLGFKLSSASAYALQARSINSRPAWLWRRGSQGKCSDPSH